MHLSSDVKLYGIYLSKRVSLSSHRKLLFQGGTKEQIRVLHWLNRQESNGLVLIYLSFFDILTCHSLI